jgi:hypothetical protein
MINIVGSTSLIFGFPADLPISFKYYSDLSRILHYLPHISILKKHTDDQYRMLYETTELGIYRVKVFCDIQVKSEWDTHTLSIRPLNNSVKPVKSHAGLYSLTGQGYYSSQTKFQAHGNQTKIDFSLKLQSELPVPLSLRLMPENLLNNIAGSITNWRIREIADGFIEKSIATYQMPPSAE